MRKKEGVEKKADVICEAPFEMSAALVCFKFFLCEPILDNIDPRGGFLLANTTVQSSQQMSSLSEACYRHLKLSNAWKKGGKIMLAL